MKKALVLFLMVSSCLYSDMPEWLYMQKSIMMADEKPVSSVRIGTVHNIFLSNEDLFTTGLSWNQYYNKQFTTSMGVGYRRLFNGDVFGFHHFVDVSNFSGLFAGQTGLSLEYFTWPFELRANFNIPWAVSKEKRKSTISYHKVFDISAAVFPMGNFKIGINPSYCATNNQFGMKGSFRWFVNRLVSAEFIGGYDPITKKTAHLSFHFGPGPNDSSVVSPVLRNYHISHTKKRKNNVQGGSLPCLSITPTKDDTNVVTFVGSSSEEKQEADSQQKEAGSSSPFFLWRLLGISNS